MSEEVDHCAGGFDTHHGESSFSKAKYKRLKVESGDDRVGDFFERDTFKQVAKAGREQSETIEGTSPGNAIVEKETVTGRSSNILCAVWQATSRFARLDSTPAQPEIHRERSSPFSTRVYMRGLLLSVVIVP